VQASQLIASVSASRLYLTLLPPNYTPEPIPQPEPYLPALPGENGTQMTPYGPTGIQNQR
jgi:hypothetical protein